MCAKITSANTPDFLCWESWAQAIYILDSCLSIIQTISALFLAGDLIDNNPDYPVYFFPLLAGVMVGNIPD